MFSSEIPSKQNSSTKIVSDHVVLKIGQYLLVVVVTLELSHDLAAKEIKKQK